MLIICNLLLRAGPTYATGSPSLDPQLPRQALIRALLAHYIARKPSLSCFH